MRLVRAAPELFCGVCEQWLSGSAGLCACRPCSACYFLEVIRPNPPSLHPPPPSWKGSYAKWQPWNMHSLCSLHRAFAPLPAIFSPSHCPFSKPIFFLLTSHHLLLIPPSWIILSFFQVFRHLPACHPLLPLTGFSSLESFFLLHTAFTIKPISCPRATALFCVLVCQWNKIRAMKE